MRFFLKFRLMLAFTVLVIFIGIGGIIFSVSHNQLWKIFLPGIASAQTTSAPPTPGTPTPSIYSGNTGSLYYFSAPLYRDPDGNTVQAVFDWGDGSPNFTTGLVNFPSGFSGSMSYDGSHVWNTAGTYYIKVKAVDSTGLSSAWSSPATMKIGSQPNPPTPTATVSGNNVTINWTYDGPTNVAGFKMSRQNPDGSVMSPGPGEWGSTVRSYTDTNVPVGTYYYYMQAYSGGGASPLFLSSNSGFVKAVVSASATIPASPFGLSVSGSSPISIGIYWADNSTDETEFRIERRFNNGTWSQIGTVMGNATTKATTNVNTFFTDDNLSVAGAYEYRVKACNSAGCSAESNTTSRTIDAAAPAVPSNLTATAGAGSIVLNWIDTSTGEWGFRLKRRVKGTTSWFGLASVFNNSSGSAVSFLDTYQLASNTTYEYVVHSYNTYESDDSNIVSVNFGTTTVADAFPAISAFVKSANELHPSTIFAGLRAYISITITDDKGIASASFNAPGMRYSGATVTLSQCANNVKTCSEPVYIVVPDKSGPYIITVSATDSAGQTVTQTVTFNAQGCAADVDCGGKYFPSSGATFCGISGASVYDKRMKYQVNSVCAAGSCSESTAPGVLEDCAATGKMCGFSQANGGQFQCVAIPSSSCAPNTKITSSCKCGPETSDGTAYGYCCLDSSNKPYLSPFVCSSTISSPVSPPTASATSSLVLVPGAGAPEPSNDEAGVWAQVDTASGQIMNTAICTRAVCGLNGEWHGYVPPVSFASGSTWWPTSKRYIWQFPGQAGYRSGTFNFNTYIFTVEGGTIYNGRFTKTTSSAPIQTPAAAPASASTSTHASSSASAPNTSPQVSIFTCPDGSVMQAGIACPSAPQTCAANTVLLPNGQCAAKDTTQLGQCLQSGGVWCYSDTSSTVLGYCAPVQSACKRAEQTQFSILSQNSTQVGPRALASEEKRVEPQTQEQFLANRRAVLQDLRALERLVKRDIIDIDSKQLKKIKDKILSLKSDETEDSAELKTYQEQIASLHGAATSSERAPVIDPRVDAGALRKLKQGLRLFERHIAALEAKASQIKKSGLTVDTSIIEAIARAKEMAKEVKQAESYNDIRDIAEQIPDAGQELNDALPRLEELLRLPGVLRLANRRIAEGEKAITQASVSAKRLKLEVDDKLETMGALIADAKNMVASVKTGEAAEGLTDIFKEQVFEKMDELFELAENIRAVAGVRQTVNRLNADIKRYETRARALKARDENKQNAAQLLDQLKARAADLKNLSTQTITPDTGVQIIDHLETLTDLKDEMEDMLHISPPDALQEQVKRILSSPSEKIKPFKVEQLEQGIL